MLLPILGSDYKNVNINGNNNMIADITILHKIHFIFDVTPLICLFMSYILITNLLILHKNIQITFFTININIEILGDLNYLLFKDL